MTKAVAREKFATLREETVHPLTRDGFIAAWTQMCGRPPVDDVVETWWASLLALAKAAGWKYDVETDEFLDWHD